ncbi:MAG TPA: hypothetical protein VJ853_07790, partial [Thermoanaerobaculia bacterium]|nr:hypothetical protein [Thermoanaerobaculia bacterium]
SAIAMRVGAVDRPGPRKVHQTPTPRLGGVAVVVSSTIVFAGMALSARVRMPAYDLLFAVAIGLIPVLAASLYDDIRGLRAVPKLLFHLAGATTTVLLGVQLSEHIHLFTYEIHIGWIAVPISILWLAGMTSAFNIVDGLDGLSAGLALISAISLAAVSLVNQRYEMASAALVLGGSLCGFLPYNIFPAKVYLGDTGATALGFFLGALTLRGGSTTSAGLAVMLPMLVVGVPLAETLLSMARRSVARLQGGRGGVFEADRNHIHHRLLAMGFDHRRAVVVLYGAGVVVAGCALLSLFVDQQNAALLLATLLAGALFGIAKLGYDEFAVVRSGAVLRIYDQAVLRSGLFVVFVDLALIATSIYAAVVLKYDDWSVRQHRQIALSLIALASALTVATFGVMRIYKQSWSNANIDDLMRSSLAAIIAVAATMVAGRLMIGGAAPYTFFALYGIVFIGLVNASRASYRVLFHWNRRSNQQGQPVLIYGAGKGGVLAVREMLSNSEVEMRPIGFIDDDPQKHGRVVNGYPVLGDLDVLESVVLSSKANGVVVASEKIPIANVRRARRACERHGAWLTFFEVNFRRSSEAGGKRLREI